MGCIEQSSNLGELRLYLLVEEQLVVSVSVRCCHGSIKFNGKGLNF